MTADTVQLPILAYDDEDWTKLFFATEAQRHRLVDKLWEGYPDVPPAPGEWARSPLTRWSWLVLQVNDLQPDPDDFKPIIHFGIDLGFSSTDVRKWIWVLA